jgi:uncharacterized Zn-binding protein involved in type VI secretion
MRPICVLLVGLLPLCAGAQLAVAQPAPPSAGQPGIVTQGSQDTLIGGKPAARVGDHTTDGALVEGSSNVFINGKPAAMVGGRTGCGGVTVGGSSNVFINGKPAAQAGSLTTGCGK